MIHQRVMALLMVYNVDPSRVTGALSMDGAENRSAQRRGVSINSPACGHASDNMKRLTGSCVLRDAS